MWRKIPDWLYYLGIVLIIYLNASLASNKIDAPLPPQELGIMLPSESPRDEHIILNIEPPQPGIGTAFAIDNKGHWMTARHVVDSCNQIGLTVGRSTILNVKATVSDDTDTAILFADWKREPLAHDLFSQRRVGEHGFFFGYPQGQPGEVIGTLLARGRMVIRGRYASSEPVLAWAEIGRTQGLSGPLGGLSGAPVLDEDGEIVGIVSAENPRRGRIYTVAPESLRDFMKNQATVADPLSLNSYGLEANRFRRNRRITQVNCMMK